MTGRCRYTFIFAFSLFIVVAFLTSCAKKAPVIEAEHLHSVGNAFSRYNSEKGSKDKSSWLPGEEEYPGGEVAGDGWFLQPYFELLDAEGNVYVADPVRIQKFDKQGKRIGQIVLDEDLRNFRGIYLYSRYFDKLMTGTSDTILSAEIELFDHDNLLVTTTYTGTESNRFPSKFFVIPKDLSEISSFKLPSPTKTADAKFHFDADSGEQWVSWQKSLGKKGTVVEQWAAHLDDGDALEEHIYLGTGFVAVDILPGGNFLCSTFSQTESSEHFQPDLLVINVDGKKGADLTFEIISDTYREELLCCSGGFIITSLSLEEESELRIYDCNFNKVALLSFPDRFAGWDPLWANISEDRMTVDFSPGPLDPWKLEVFSVDWPEDLLQYTN